MSSSLSTVRSALESILRDDLKVSVSVIARNSHLVEDLGLDSVAFAIGTVAIEDKLGVALTADDLVRCETFGDLEDAIAAKYRP